VANSFCITLHSDWPARHLNEHCTSSSEGLQTVDSTDDERWQLNTKIKVQNLILVPILEVSLPPAIATKLSTPSSHCKSTEECIWTQERGNSKKMRKQQKEKYHYSYSAHKMRWVWKNNTHAERELYKEF
jgi:hypothetical protein